MRVFRKLIVALAAILALSTGGAAASTLLPTTAPTASAACIQATVTYTTGTGYNYFQVHAVGTANGTCKNKFQAAATCANGTHVSGLWVTLSYVGQTGDSFANCGGTAGRVVAGGWRTSS